MNAWATRRAAFLSAFLLVVLVGVVFPGGECAEARRSHEHVLTVVEVDELPREARETLALIKQGGPFPYKTGWRHFRKPRTTPAGPTERLLPRVHRADARRPRPRGAAHRRRHA